MYRNYLFLALLSTLLIISCKKKDGDTDPDVDTVSGTYTLTSVVSSEGLDPEEDGVFGDTELIDNISCPSRLILDETNGATFEYITITQNHYNDPTGQNPMSYSPMVCANDTYTSTYSLTDNSVTVQSGGAQPTIIFNVISKSELELIETKNFPVQQNGTIVSKQLSITKKYTN